MRPIVLASASSQRRELLSGLGIVFTVMPSTVDESACKEQDPVHRAKHLSLLKAQEVAARMPDAIVIGCDTLVVSHNGTLLEKPVDADDARRMIALQSGATSRVHSGLTVIVPGKAPVTDVSTSSVHFASLSQEIIDWWIRSGHWKDRSGSFQIDGPGQYLIDHIEGDWTSIVGLPVFLLGQLLTKAGYSLFP